jgi:hypothetical protein
MLPPLVFVALCIAAIPARRIARPYVSRLRWWLHDL